MQENGPVRSGGHFEVKLLGAHLHIFPTPQPQPQPQPHLWRWGWRKVWLGDFVHMFSLICGPEVHGGRGTWTADHGGMACVVAWGEAASDPVAAQITPIQPSG